jgi:hypothetical protein
MKALAYAAVLITSALGTSACASAHSAPNQSSTDAVQLHESTYGRLSQPLRNFIHSIEAGSPDGPVTEIDVYGPGSRAALVKASSGDVVLESPRERPLRFYLVVVRGQFVCAGCSGPPGHRPPRGTIETHVWSPVEGGTDFGISDKLPAAVSSLPQLAAITLS